MEAAMINPFSSSFTGSTDIQLFQADGGDAARKSIIARQREVVRRCQEWVPRITSPEIVSEYSDSLRIFNAIQALYLSSNKPRDRQIAERITQLHRDVLAEGEQISPVSLAQFTEFFLRYRELGFPRITMTPDGTLRARWIHGPESFVAIEFTGTPLVKVVAEIPREGGQIATYFAAEPFDYVEPICRAIGASFE